MHALAHEQNLAPNAAGLSATFPSGVTATLSATSDTVNGGTTFTANGAALAGNPAASYTPGINRNATTFNLTTAPTALATIGANTPKGTITIQFSTPVTNPRLHFARLGGVNGTEAHATAWTLTNGATGTVADMTAVSGAVTVVSAAGLARLQTTSNAPTTACATPASSSGCGTIQVNGTYRILTFNVVLQYRSGVGCATPTTCNQALDSYGLAISLNEDFGDAPASYDNGTVAAAHLHSDLALGAGGNAEPNPPVGGVAANVGLTVDAATTVYAALPAASPIPGNSTAGSDVDNAFASLPTVYGSAATYSLAVPLSGLSAAAQLCGWIDFNRNAIFESTERNCATPPAGSTTAGLVWTLPSGTAYVAGNSYARFRLSYDVDAQNPTGAADSGEVEDYPIVLLPRMRLTKAVSPTTDSGLFNLSISPTVLPAGAATANNVGHAGTTGMATMDMGTQVTVSETAGTSTVLTSYASSRACVNRAGAAVLIAANGTTGSFTSMTSASTSANATPASTSNINDTEITCTITNTRLGADLALTKTNTPGVNADRDQIADTLVSGTTTSYTITALNAGPGAANGAIVSDTPASGLTGCSVNQCTSSNGATCPANPSDLLAAGATIPVLPVTGVVIFIVQCTAL